MGLVLGTEPASVGSVLDAAFRLFRHAYTRLLPIVAIATLLSFGFQIQSNSALFLPLVGLRPLTFDSVRNGEMNPLAVVLFIVLAIAVFILVTAAEAAVMHRAYQAESDAGSFGESWRVGLRRAPRLIGFGFAVGLMLVVPGGIGAAVIVALWSAGQLALAVIAGLVLLVVAMYVVSRLFLTTPEIVLRDRRVSEAMRSSWRLTKGRLNRMGVLFIVIVAITLVFYIVWGVVAGLIAGAFFAVAGASAAIAKVGTVLFVGLAPLVVTPYRVSATIAVWHDFLLRTEGTDLSAKIAALPDAG